MKVSELGEFGLIERLHRVLDVRPRAAQPGRLAIGIGDDGAVWVDGEGPVPGTGARSATIATTDTLVAGVHFLPDAAPWADVGWKAIAVNVSDVAAMGGTPEFALVTLGLPADADCEDIDRLYTGIAEACGAYDMSIAGGDIVRADQFFITVALYGRADVDADDSLLVLRRDAAATGDIVAVTGCLGGSAGGLRALQDTSPDSDAKRALIARHLRPQPRAAVGPVAVAAGLRCAIDVSDGLLQDIGHVCEASGLGAVIHQAAVPIEPALIELYGHEEALRMADSGGEDYELLLIGGRDALDSLREQIDVSLTEIGEMVADDAGRVRLLDAAGRDLVVGAAGFDHLRGAR